MKLDPSQLALFIDLISFDYVYTHLCVQSHDLLHEIGGSGASPLGISLRLRPAKDLIGTWCGHIEITGFTTSGTQKAVRTSRSLVMLNGYFFRSLID